MSKRKGIANTLVWVLMGLLFVGLAGFGATNLSGNIRTIGSVGDIPIEVNKYARALQQEMQAFEAQTGSSVTFAQAQSLGLDRQVLGQLITAAALENEADRIGVSIGDASLLQQLQDIAAFQGPDGQFSKDTYKYALQNAGLTEAEFETGLKRETGRTLLQGAVVAGNTVSDTYLDAIIGYVGERRSFTWSQIDPAELEQPIAGATDADLRAYYDANTDAFMLPETRRITYAWLTPEMIIDTIEIEEDLLRNQYAEREGEYRQPERRLVERLVFANAEEAANAKTQIDAGGTDFDTLVQGRGLTLSDVDMGDLSLADLGAGGDIVFAAGVGEVAGPVNSDLGPALYRVNGVLPANETSFEDARADLRDELATDRARRVIAGMAETVNDLLAGGATLEDLAKETDMRAGTIDWFEGADGEIAAYNEFRATAAELSEGDFPEVLQLDDGGIYAMRLEGVTPPRPEPFEEARDSVEVAWRAAETTKALTAIAETLRSQLQEGRTFASLGVETVSETDRTRTEFLSDAPAALLAAAFNLEPGASDIVEADGTVTLIQLDRIAPADKGSIENAELRRRIADQAANGVSQDLFQVFARDAQSRAGIELDQQALNAVHAQFQ